ncbi:hypothetical protein C1J03_12215 [Sulfitobacter sp. SK012]|uniref:hypothetical protein n=1 Tax=Sulfitobacter sp. SK012 TaxID=1389005 RepID=UPI000E0BCAB7|nr:hypothetical protein [Sulfitobacter sp. SK012]AXI46718.1 hypothetical protein C1J03_12215 [Sulfitobacter sp. SK012]
MTKSSKRCDLRVPLKKSLECDREKIPIKQVPITDGERHQQRCQILERLSTHLNFLAGRIFEVEHAIGNQSFLAEAVSSQICEVQTLDFLRQSLEDMSIAAHLLSQERQIENDFKTLLFQQLKLDSSHAALSGEEYPSIGKQNGDLDLF